MPKFKPLDDAEIFGDPELSRPAPLGWTDLANAYRELREHLALVTRGAETRDRTTLLRMAADVAGGIAHSHTSAYGTNYHTDTIASRAVEIARAVLDEVDEG